MFPRAPLPERIGAYSVLRRLPSAGGADRYLGREDGPRGFTRMVELKLAPAEADPEVSSELAHEAAVVARLNHPYIARMYNFFEHEGRLVLVLERVEGTTLGRILASARRRRQKLPDEAVYHVAHRLVSAIAHAHGMTDDDDQSTPVVHRSISPASLMVGWGGEVRLSGFGLAKIMGRSPDTVVGLVKGTPGYMAPEQMRGERITERTDIYQAGLVIWEMLSGNQPAVAGAPQKNRQAELVLMMNGPELAPVSTLRPSVPREIAAVFDAMLEPSVEKRKISAQEVERWLAKTVDVERGKEALRERAIALRGQEVRDSVSGAEPVRAASPLRRTGTQRRDAEAAPSMRRPMRTPASGELQLPPSLVSPEIIDSGAVSPGPLVVAPVITPAIPPTPRPPDVAAVAGPSAVLPPTPAAPAVAATVDPHTPNPSRVTLPDSEPGAEQHIPVEGERGAATLITLRRSSRAPLVIAASVGGVMLLGGGVWLVRGQVAPTPPAASSAPAPIPTPTVSEEAPPPTPPPSAAPALPLPNLGPRQGALLVKASAPGLVYLNGAIAGDTDKVLVVNCGTRFVRVGAASQVGGRTLWLTAGTSVKVPCGVLTEVDSTVGNAPRK